MPAAFGFEPRLAEHQEAIFVTLRSFNRSTCRTLLFAKKKRKLVKKSRTVVTATVNHLDMTEILLKTGY